MKELINIISFGVLVLPLMLTSCQQPGGNDPGSEYMPDMGHSVAYEANVYTQYYMNTWDAASVKKLKELSVPRLPVAGTVPRGFAGIHYAGTTTAKNAVMGDLKGETSISAISVPVNGSVPYYYEDTEEERTRATNEIIHNPFPITAKGLAQGKELYNINCGICHGDKGDGNGWLVDEKNLKAVYPAQPAILISDEFTAASNGRFYHSIMYGKNVMGSYADKLSYEERWNVIHYIRSLQAKNAKLVYNEKINTLNSIDVPEGAIKQVAAHDDPGHDENHSVEDHGDSNQTEGDHGGDHNHDEGTHEDGHEGGQ